MKSHDLVRVKHMIEAADEAVSFARGKSRGPSHQRERGHDR
jgi:hypothetical protein